MIIEPNWTVSAQGPWQLIYNETQIVSLHEAQGTTSTEGNLFVGTRAECEAEIDRLGLPYPQAGTTDTPPEPPPLPPGFYDSIYPPTVNEEPESNPEITDPDILAE